MTELSKLRLSQLKEAILKDQFYGIDFKEAFHVDYEKTLGVDEFPHDRDFLIAFFGLTEAEFDDIFIPKDLTIRTIEQFLQHLDTFL